MTDQHSSVTEIQIRPLEPRDRAAVRRISRAVWRGGDYIPLAFTEWIKDGGFYGAVLDGELVGFAKLTRMSRTEAFLEGLRVAPHARRHGVGEALIRYRLDRARRVGMRVARFVTWSENDAMHRMAKRLGFRRGGEDVWLRARPGAGPPLRVATRRDADRLLTLARSRPALLREDHYASRFRALTRHDVLDGIDARRCLVLDGSAGPVAFVILGPDRARTVYLASAPRALGAFASGYRTYARGRPKTRVFFTAPRSAMRALERIGYRKSGRGYGVVFERALSALPRTGRLRSRS